MKHIFLFLVATLSQGAFADPMRECPQATTSFESALLNYDSCKARGSLLSCQNFCASANLLLGSPGTVGGGQICSASDIENARNQGRQEVLRDLSVSHSIVSPEFYGTNQSDCRDRAVANTADIVINAERECNRKAISIRQCRVVGEPRLRGAFGQLPRIQGTSKVEVRADRTDRATCERQSIERAQQNALEQCQRVTGATCSLTSDVPTASYRVQRNPFGSDQRECRGSAYASPGADVTYRCTIEVTARNQASVI